MKNLLANLLLGAAMLSLLLAAVLSLRRAELARRALLATLVALVVYGVVVLASGRPGRLDLADLDRRCATVRLALEQHRARNGGYPSTIEETGVSVPDTPLGPLRYAVTTDAPEPYYTLSVAASPEAPPVAVWDSRDPNAGWSAGAE